MTQSRHEVDPVTFEPFPKIYRLFRPVIISEKLDGTNAAVGIIQAPPGYGAGEIVGPCIVVNRDADQQGSGYAGWDPVFVYAQSRKRIIAPGDDNFGFAAWVRDHAHELAMGLGPGLHFGEWFGHGIQRGYGLTEKRFSLFNTSRWDDDAVRPNCCHVVPVLTESDVFKEGDILLALLELEQNGSSAAPGFTNPEGIVVFHAQSNALFKVTVEDDHKGIAHGA